MVVAPSAALAPPWTVAPSTTMPPDEVHALKSPDSKPSAKTGGGGGGVVTETVLPSADTLPAMSLARTAYWCVDEPNTASENVVTGPSEA